MRLSHCGRSPLPSVPRAQFEMVSASLRLHTPISHWASASLHRPQGALGSALHPSGAVRDGVCFTSFAHTYLSLGFRFIFAFGECPTGAPFTSAPTGDMSLHSESQDEIRKRIPKLFSSFRAHAVKVKIGRADFAIINGKAADDGFKQGGPPCTPSFRIFLPSRLNCNPIFLENAKT